MSIANEICQVVQVKLAGGFDARPTISSFSGNQTTAPLTASYIYSVTDLSGNVLGTNLTPTKPRKPNTSYLPGQGLGLGYNDQNGDFQLLDAFEQERTIP